MADLLLRGVTFAMAILVGVFVLFDRLVSFSKPKRLKLDLLFTVAAALGVIVLALTGQTQVGIAWLIILVACITGFILDLIKIPEEK